jgi:hypothetical protein
MEVSVKREVVVFLAVFVVAFAGFGLFLVLTRSGTFQVSHEQAVSLISPNYPEPPDGERSGRAAAVKIVNEIRRQRDAAEGLRQATQIPRTILGLGPKHWVKNKYSSGEFVQLEDNSVWQIAPLDKINTMLWLPTEEVVVVASQNALYPYSLIGRRDKADAQLIAKLPRLKGLP